MSVHSQLTGLELHESFHFVQETDPGAVGANLYWLKVSTGILKRRKSDNSGWDTIGGGGGGASAFTDLTDVPNSYTGQANKLVSVKGDETGLEFTTTGGVPTWVTNSPDTPPVSPNADDDEMDNPATLPGGGSATWAWTNQDSATATITNSLLNFATTSRSSLGETLLLKSIASGNFTAITRIKPISQGAAVTTQFSGAFVVKVNANNNYIGLYIGYDSTWRTYIQALNSTSSFGSTLTDYGSIIQQGWYWMKITRVSDTLTWYLSYDGIHYFSIGSTTQTISFSGTAIDRIGFSMRNTNSKAANLIIDYYRKS